MSAILYKLVNGKPVKEMVEALVVSDLLKNGYRSNPSELFKSLSDKDIKAAAKEAGLTIGRKSVKTLKEELGYE
jgi:ribosomal protein L9